MKTTTATAVAAGLTMLFPFLSSTTTTGGRARAFVHSPPNLPRTPRRVVHRRWNPTEGGLRSASTPARLALSSSPSPYQPYTQVVSDVDDTLKSSGGVNVAGVALGGIDVQYSRGTFYPGVFQFMLELSLHSLLDVDVDVEGDDDGSSPSSSPGRISSSSTERESPPKVAVLTARAVEFKAALELKDDSKLAIAFRSAGEKMGYDGWGLGPVLYGSVAEWVVQDRKGLRKFSNFERLIRQDPTGTVMQYVYVGDTGELDQEAGETMLREYPEVVKAVFLHVVSDRPFPTVPPPKLINGRPVVFFRTYVGAAAKARQLGLMDDDGLARVVNAAEEDLDGMDVNRNDERWIDLERDVEEAYRTLGIDGE